MKAGRCKNGHRLTGRNAETWEQKVITDGEVTFRTKTGCRKCRRKNAVRRCRAAGMRKRMRRAWCPSKHRFTPENTRIKRNGRRDCRACHKQSCAMYRWRQRERAEGKAA